jgi:hypothetical protein
VQHFDWSPSTSFGVHGLICETCEALGVVVMGCEVGVRAGGVGTMFFDLLALII